MDKSNILQIANDNNGYLYSDVIKKHNIKSIYISRLVSEGKLNKVARGIYVTETGIEDELFINSLQYKRIIYSGETALYLNGLSNKQYPSYEATVPFGYNNKIDGIKIRYTRKNTFNVGVEYVETMFGNKVKAYNKERCICDLFINPDDYDYEERVFAINEYKNNYLDLNKLYECARKMGVYDKIRDVFEVIGWN